MSELSWTCAVCQTPVLDGQGHLVVDMPAVNEAEQRWGDLGDKHSGGYSVGDLLAAPDPVEWRAVHLTCEPEGSPYAIEIANVRTHAGLLAWTSHLMEKSWLRFTNWSQLIADKAGVGLN